MGQRVNPYGFRLGVIRSHHAQWYAKNSKEYARMIAEDSEIRSMLKKKFRRAGISRIIISRSEKLSITMHVNMVGLIIGKKGVIIDALKAELDKKYNIDTQINVKEVKKPDCDGEIVSNAIAMKMEERSGGFKLTVKRVMQATMESGALGIRVLLSGRLGGAEIARNEEFVKGSVPLQTLQADISYGLATAYTSAGTTGVKVWIYRGMNRKKYNPFEGANDRYARDANAEYERAAEIEAAHS